MVGGIASAINAVAGGGSLLSFPTLRFMTGMGSTVANATNSISLWPGSLGGAFGYRNLYEVIKKDLRLLTLPTILGSLAGAILLVKTDPHVFDLVVPWLILFAAVLLLAQPKLKKWMSREGHVRVSPWVGIFLQFLVSVYGGYFGAGMGIMMLASFALYIEGSIHELNAVKNLLGLFINFTCSIVFVLQGLIDFRVGLILSSGAVFGGFLAAKYSQRVDPEKLRLGIAVYGVGMAGFYMLRSVGKI